MQNISITLSRIGNEGKQQQPGDYQKAVLYTAGAIFLIFINAMTIVSYFLRKKTKRCIPDLFMLNMAVSSIVTIVAVILILAYIRATGNESYDGLQFLCYIQVYFGTMTRLLDVSITTAIMIDRFVALYKPLVYRVKIKFNHGRIVCAILWIESGLIAMLPLVGFGQISMHMESFCTADWTSDIAYIVLIVAYFQFGIVLISYVGIFRAITGLVTRQTTMKNSQQSMSYVSPRIQHRVIPNNETSRENKSEISLVYLRRDDESVLSRSSFLKKQNREEREENFNSDMVIENKTAFLLTDREGSLIEAKHDENHEITITAITATTETVKKTNRSVSWFDEKEEQESNSKRNKTTRITNLGSLPDLVVDAHERISQAGQAGQQYSSEHQEPDEKFVNNTPTTTLSKLKQLFRPISNLRRNLTVRQRRASRGSSNIKDFRTENLRFAKIMGVVVFLFYLSWTPLAVSHQYKINFVDLRDL